MRFPSSIGGATTDEVGFIEALVSEVGPWLDSSFGPGWSLGRPHWTSFDQAVRDLAPTPVFTKQALIPVGGDWTLLLTNGPLGTDNGMLPSLAARKLGRRGVRAAAVEDGEERSGRILEVYSPDGEQPLLLLRSIVAAKDGRWGFWESGEVLPFERVEYYTRRRKSERFPSELLAEYLRALDVPIDQEPDWSESLLLSLNGS